MNLSVVSIIIPVYNRATIVSSTLDSIINQSFRNWECILIDDFSTDNTMEVLLNYQKRDVRFKVLKNSRKKGAQGARNSGLLLAKGDFIVFFDSDDLMLPHNLEKKIHYLNSKISCDIVTSFTKILNKEGTIIGVFNWKTEGEIFKYLIKGDLYVDMNSALIRKSKLELIGLLDEDCPSYQELDLHLRLSKISKYSYIPEYLVYYYRRGESTISSNKKLDILGRLYLFSKYNDNYRNIMNSNLFYKNLNRLKYDASTYDININEYLIFSMKDRYHLLKISWLNLLTYFLKCRSYVN